MRITKKLILLFVIICIGKFSSAQFTGSNPITQSSTGNVGINILSPGAVIAPLEVKNGSVLFDGALGTYPALSGAGTRMLWYPAKAAFRAGSITSTQWDDANIGVNSFACGLSTTASGVQSSAFGGGTASGVRAAAFGTSTASNTGATSFNAGIASGSGAFAINGTASGNLSFSAGTNTTASGLSACSFGTTTTAYGYYSAAWGTNTTAESGYEFVIGKFNVLNAAYNRTAWVSTDPLFVIGNGSSAAAPNNALTVLKNGNVLINKVTQLNPNYLLDVNGKIRSNEIVVNTTGADFVFEKNYSLLSLNELEQKLKQDKHLPGIASAKEMQENGVGLAELNTSLLQKTEELTLYIIELNKRIEALEKKNK